MANQQIKTSMGLFRCLGKDDQPYLLAVVQGKFFHADTALKAVKEDLSVVHCDMMISGQEDYVAKFLGGWKPEVNDRGVVWVQVSFFNKTAERFLNFAAKYPDASIVVTGSLLVSPYTSKKDNQQHWSLSISANGFYAPNAIPKAGGAAPAYGAPAGYGAPAAPAMPSGYGAPAAAPAAPGGYGAPAPAQAPAAPGGYAAPAAPGGYAAPAPAPSQAPAPAPAAPGGYAAPAAPGGYAAPAAPGGYGAPAPAGAAPVPGKDGFYNIDDDEGKLPF